MISYLLKLLPDRRLSGVLTFRYSPKFGYDRWGGPFNGQRARCQLFADIMNVMKPKGIIETGTYLGTTTEWISAWQLPVYSCEADEWNFGFASAKLKGLKNIRLLCNDSRSALKALAAKDLSGATSDELLFYLDAHWEDDLPLADELDIIFGTFEKAVVIIDDFEVEGDTGYGFDDYGNDNTLEFNYIESRVNKYDCDVLYPSAPSNLETGGRRGCVVLVSDDQLRKKISSLPALKLRDKR